MADQVLYSGVACITDLMVKEGLINLDFADVRAVMREMGKAMMGTGEASGEKRSLRAAEAAISNPLIDDVSMRGAKGLLISITGGNDLTLYEVDEAATRIREEVDADANIIVGATFDESLEGIIRVSVVATGVDQVATLRAAPPPPTHAHEARIAEVAQRARAEAQRTQAATLRRRSRASSRRTVAHSQPPRRPPSARRLPRRLPPPCCRARRTDDLTIRPIPQKPSLFIEPIVQEKPAEPVMPAAFIPPQAGTPGRFARRACRGSKNCRCRRRTRSAPAIATRQQEDPLEKPRMSLLQRLASVGLGGRREEAEPRPAAGAAPDAATGPHAASGPAFSAADATRPSRCRSSPSGRPRRGSIRTAGRPLCITTARRTSSTSRHSCAARPTEHVRWRRSNRGLRSNGRSPRLLMG